MKTDYTENSQIEFRLTHNVSDHYWLEWRFKEPKKIWIFKKYDKWKGIHYYIQGTFTPKDDPDREFAWYWRGFHLGRQKDVEEYDYIINNIKTKKELYKYFRVEDNIKKYLEHLEEHKKWLKAYSSNIEKYVL